MHAGRSSRRRVCKRRRRIEAGNITQGEIRRILDNWRKEAEYRARIAFGEGCGRTGPAVWALYRAKLQEAIRLEKVRRAIMSGNIQKARMAEQAGNLVEAQRLKESCSQIAVDQELAEFCRRAIAKYTDPASNRRKFILGMDVCMVRT